MFQTTPTRCFSDKDNWVFDKNNPTLVSTLKVDAGTLSNLKPVRCEPRGKPTQTERVNSLPAREITEGKITTFYYDY
jgi:hypothetical protein